MKRILIKLALFFGLLGAIPVMLLLAPWSEEFAYHYIQNDCYNHGAWIYDRVARNQTSIDIALIGSSHTIHAFQDKKMEEFTGSNCHVTNLGYCRFGRNIEFLFVKMLLKYKSPQLVVLEIHEDEEMNSHDIFPYLAETRDLILSPTIVNRDYFSDVFNGVSARLEQFKARYIFSKKYPVPSSELYGYANSERIATDQELDKNSIAWQSRLAEKKPKEIERMQLKYPFAYLEKTIKHLKNRNIPFVFVYLPEFGSLLRVPKQMEYYTKWAPVLTPPSHIFDDRANWMDASHLNDSGSEKTTVWIAKMLSDKCSLDSIKQNQKF